MATRRYISEILLQYFVSHTKMEAMKTIFLAIYELLKYPSYKKFSCVYHNGDNAQLLPQETLGSEFPFKSFLTT
jgi:hypothetical protein